jgi:5'-phosphate synthase pdxT subunit
VLAIQGDFAAHAQVLTRMGCEVREIRRAAEMEGLDGLVVPGGESTTLVKLLRAFDLWEPLRAFPEQGRPLFGTCAGLILLAEQVANPPQESLGLLPVDVRRNAYGRQVESFITRGRVRVPGDLTLPPGIPFGDAEARIFATEFVFIRAPMITALRDGADVLATSDGVAVLVRKGQILGASYHPELSSDGLTEGIFVAMAAQARAQRGGRAERPRARGGGEGGRRGATRSCGSPRGC